MYHEVARARVDAASRWLAERIPGVEAHISEEDGHLSIAVGRLGEIYDWLASRF